MIRTARNSPSRSDYESVNIEAENSENNEVSNGETGTPPVPFSAAINSATQQEDEMKPISESSIISRLSNWFLEVYKKHKICFKFGLLFLQFATRVSFYLYDLTSDIVLIDEYWNDRHMWYFWLTLAFVVSPALLISYINGKYYHEKWKVRRQIKKNDKYELEKKLIVDPDWKFILRFVLCLPLISPIARYKSVKQNSV